jgi:hypothetical protein
VGGEIMVAAMYSIAFVAGLNMALSATPAEMVKFGMLTTAAISSALITGAYTELTKLRGDVEEIMEMLRELKGREPN